MFEQRLVLEAVTYPVSAEYYRYGIGSVRCRFQIIIGLALRIQELHVNAHFNQRGH